MIIPGGGRDLTLVQSSAPHRPAYLSAASGLVCEQGWIYVIADDEHHLGVFRRDQAAPGILFRLVAGDLPAGKKDRKKHKPDFEVLLRLPTFGLYPHGALLAAGSGSRANRRSGVLIGLDRAGVLQGEPKTVDLSFVLGSLEGEFPALNIEGALVLGGELLLFQRGNKKNSTNAIVRFSLARFLDALGAKEPPQLLPLSTQSFDLGGIDGVPLTFTDAAGLAGGDIVFSAAAEDTDDSYNDGKCLGSALGLIAADGALHWIRNLSQRHKIEGLDARREGSDIRVLMVSDADDIAVPAKLLAATTPYDRDS